MSGSFKLFESAPPLPGRHDHVIFETDGGATVRFCDPRRFGLMTLTDAAGLDRHPLLAKMGPEPLADGFDGPLLAARLDGRTGSIKAGLLDQTVVAGIGNIYASESLFRAGLSPRRRAGTVKGRRAGRLADAIGGVLREAIAAGGSSLRDHRQPSGEVGYFQHSLAVYGREGEPCPGCDCDGAIGRMVQSGRSTFYCAKRQR
jgi:formamidopyrimidine-DNA glycosylase